MSQSVIIFLVGMAMLALFLYYFGTEIDRRKRYAGTILTLFVSAFAIFSIVNTSHRPDGYTILFERAEAVNGNTDLDSELRESISERISSELGKKDSSNKETLSSAGIANTISISRPALPMDDVQAAIQKIGDQLGVKATITKEPRPATDLDMGIDLKGGSSFLVQLGRDGDSVVTDSMRDEAISVFDKRLNPTGNKDLLIAPQGDDRILIQMPGVKPEETEDIRKKIEQVAKLEFRMVHPDSAAELAKKTSPTDTIFVPGFVEMKQRPESDGTPNPPLLVTNHPDITGDQVTSAFGNYGPDGWDVSLNLTDEGGDTFFQLSKRAGERIAIIVDEEIISAPGFYSGPIAGGQVRISGNFTQAEVLSLASNLENPLQVSPVIVNEQSVSPTYGKDTIRQGITAGLVGLAIVLVFIVIYYKAAGLVALAGLVINILMLLGALCIFDLTLTMPGIAGIVLIIGVAIDANVIIYERLREELKDGRPIGAAIRGAYEKAFSSIFDANITTLITAIILFIVASSTVKGFAVTLISGILASLFSSLLVTRVCFMWLTNDGRGGLLKGINLWSFLPDRLYDVISKRRKAAVISLVMIAISIGTFVMKRADSLSPDFAGGSLITLRATDTVDLAKVKESLSDITDLPHTAQRLGSPSGQDFITVRTSFSDPTDGGVNTAQRLIDEIEKDTGATLADVQIESVGPLIGVELAKSSGMALLFGMIGIFFYLVFRFEVSFAIGAIIALIHDVGIVLGLVVLCGEQLSLIHVGAFLTLAGYSINDTIIVFDRIRENLTTKRGDTAEIMNLAISQTLSRTMLTSSTTLVVVAALAVFGGPALRDFSVTLFIGIVVGTYSSIFVAAPIVLWWSSRKGGNLRREVLDAELARRIDDSGIEREVPEKA